MKLTEDNDKRLHTKSDSNHHWNDAIFQRDFFFLIITIIIGFSDVFMGGDERDLPLDFFKK